MTPATLEGTAAKAATTKPIKVFRLENVSASIFPRRRTVEGRELTFYNVAFSRSYTRKDGSRGWTDGFDYEDLGRLALVVKQAADFVTSLQYPPPETIPVTN